MRGAARIAALALAALIGGGGASADAPGRVVSINLCTDQLAMMLATPGQLVSVSALAADPRASAMAAEAAGLALNRGRAEEVFLMRPDLVLAGTYTARGSVDLLRRLGFAIVELPPAQGLGDIAAQLRAVGAALGRAAEAERAVAAFEADLAALTVESATRPAAVLYYPNGYTPGAGTLADDILRITAFRNLGAEAGVTGGAQALYSMKLRKTPALRAMLLPEPGRPPMPVEMWRYISKSLPYRIWKYLYGKMHLRM